MVSSLVSKLSMKVSVSVSVSNFGYAWYQYQYQYRNFRPAEYQYRIGIEFVDQESISIVSVSEKVVSKGSGTYIHTYGSKGKNLFQIMHRSRVSWDAWGFWGRMAGFVKSKWSPRC